MSSSLGKPCSTNRNWTIIQFYCAALCVLLVTKGSHSAECYVSVTRCPCSMDLWNERAQNKSCGQPRNYACVLHESNILVEICTTNFIILNGTRGCPYVKRCKGKEAEFGISLRYKECPENIEGCPTKNHSEYSIYQLYQYPACFITNRTELKKETLQNYCTEEQPAGSKTKLPTEKSNSDWMILGIILATILAILVAIGLCVGKRIYNRRRKRNSESSKNKEEETPLNGNCESEKESSADTEEETAFHETRVKREGIRKLEEILLALHKSEVNNHKKLNPLVRSFMSTDGSSFFASVHLKDDVDYIVNGIRKDDDYSVKIPAKDINTPEQIFEKEGKKYLRHVYLRGDAGSGKTTFCMRLLDYWCKAHSNSEDHVSSEEEIWVDGLRKFHFVFLVSLKTVYKTESVVEMILSETDFVKHKNLHELISDVISDESYRCLIILDGLDGWKPANEVLTSLKTPWMPNIVCMSNTTLLFSSRTWKFDDISESFRDTDRMVHILGLDERGVKRIFENISFEHYKNKPQDMDEQYGRFRGKISKSFVSNPLLLTASVYLWHERNQTFETKTDLFLSVVQFLIKRYKKENPKILLAVNRDSQEVEMSYETEDIVQKYTSLRSHISDLVRLGKLAFDELVLKDTPLVFEKKVLSEMIGDFLQGVGIVSMTKTFSNLATEMVMLNFLHTNFQELLAALYVVSGHPIGLTELTSIKKILKLSYVIRFISGLTPTMGAKISKYITDIANEDEVVKMYRKTVDYEHHHIIKTLHSLLEDCYQEAEKSKMAMSLSYCVSDVYLRSNYKSDITTTKKLMKGKDIKSLYMRWIKKDDDGISDSFLTEFLQNNPQLETFYVKGKRGDRSFDAANIFNIAQKRALVLDNVTITADTLGDIRSIDRAHQLETLGLWNVTFHDSIQSPPSSMKDLLIALPLLPKLSTLYISCKMYKEDREELIRTLPKLENLTNIQYGGVSDEEEICDNDTDNRVVKRILESRANTLKRLWLDYMKLDIDSLEPIKNMNCLEKVVLRRVHMEEDPWIKTIKNIENTQRQVSVSLVCTNITETVKSTVRNSDKFILDLDIPLHYENMDIFTFCRVLN